MDSKPIAIIIGIVITVGAMGSVGLYASNILTGTSTSTDIIPKTTELIQIDKDTLEANIQFTNSGTDTLIKLTGTMEFDGAVNFLDVRNPIVEPYERVWLSGTVESKHAITKATAINSIGEPCSDFDGVTGTPQDLDSGQSLATTEPCSTPADGWDIYPGESVLIRLNMDTASGDQIEKLIEVVVR